MVWGLDELALFVLRVDWWYLPPVTSISVIIGYNCYSARRSVAVIDHLQTTASWRRSGQRLEVLGSIAGQAFLWMFG